MRKLVLSGFLASEEIYINQLEALLLVSLCSGLPVSVVLANCFWGGRRRGTWTSPSLWAESVSLALGSRGPCQKGACASRPQASLTCPGKGGRNTTVLEMNTPMASDHAQAPLIRDGALSGWGVVPRCGPGEDLASTSTLCSGQSLPVNQAESSLSCPGRSPFSSHR